MIKTITVLIFLAGAAGWCDMDCSCSCKDVVPPVAEVVVPDEEPVLQDVVIPEENDIPAQDND
jgi:hypothetical protein